MTLAAALGVWVIEGGDCGGAGCPAFNAHATRKSCKKRQVEKPVPNWDDFCFCTLSAILVIPEMSQ